MKNISVVICYEGRRAYFDNKKHYAKYTVFGLGKVSKSFNIKSEFKIWMDLNNLRIGKQNYKEEHRREFKSRIMNDYVLIGKNFSLLKREK